MRVKTFTLNSRKEIIHKITREVLALFKVEVIGRGEGADFAQLSVIHRRLPDAKGRVVVETEMLLFRDSGEKAVHRSTSIGAPDEREGAAYNRLMKLNLYRIFVRDLGYPEAPWGILHGVRPTKIVHRWIRSGMDEPSIIRRIQAEYACSKEKAEEIVPMAFRQLPFLRMSDDRTVSVYIGIPFCLSRCLYCSFPSHILPEMAKLEEFMKVFSRDLSAAKEDIERLGLRVQNLYIGGGTPTSLPDIFFAEMMDMVYNAFYHAELYEFTVEAGRPDSITDAKISKMRDCHVSRVSVNPQSMHQKTLDFIGRHHTPGDIIRMFHAFRKAGISHINMDVILGLPGEDASDVEATMKAIAELAPDDITLHALALKRGSRLWHWMEERHVDLPDTEETRKMFDAAMKVVCSLGMRPYYLYRQGYMAGDLENVGCSFPGAEGMYNIQIMEEHQTIVGIGGAAATKVVDTEAHRLRSTFHPKNLGTYLHDIDRYIGKRRGLLSTIYG